MNKLLKKLILFVAPFLLIALMIVIIDPYEYFDNTDIVDHQTKENISSNLNRILWKLLPFYKNPRQNILLGDSRMNNIKTENIRQIAGESYCNLSFGGATLSEIIESFWYAANKTKLKKVYIGINFNLYNEYNDKYRFTQAVSIIDNPLLYIKDVNTIEACYFIVCKEVLHQNIQLYKPPANKEAFWKNQLEVFTTRNYQMYKYPDKNFQKLQSISRYCKKNNIILTFIIFPTHTDLQKRVEDFRLTLQEIRFKNDIKSIGILYDFDYPNELTKNKENFGDPYHNKVQNQLIDEIWGNKMKYAKFSNLNRIN